MVMVTHHRYWIGNTVSPTYISQKTVWLIFIYIYILYTFCRAAIQKALKCRPAGHYLMSHNLCMDQFRSLSLNFILYFAELQFMIHWIADPLVITLHFAELQFRIHWITGPHIISQWVKIYVSNYARLSQRRKFEPRSTTSEENL